MLHETSNARDLSTRHSRGFIKANRIGNDGDGAIRFKKKARLWPVSTIQVLPTGAQVYTAATTQSSEVFVCIVVEVVVVVVMVCLSPGRVCGSSWRPLSRRRRGT